MILSPHLTLTRKDPFLTDVGEMFAQAFDNGPTGLLFPRQNLGNISLRLAENRHEFCLIPELAGFKKKIHALYKALTYRNIHRNYTLSCKNLLN